MKGGGLAGEAPFSVSLNAAYGCADQGTIKPVSVSIDNINKPRLSFPIAMSFDRVFLKF